MEPLLSRKDQRAKDIRDAIKEYNTFQTPWSSEYRAQAVYQGVLRNNARQQEGFYFEDDDQRRCCCCRLGCFGWLLLLVAACGAVWYTWARVADDGQKMAMNFPILAGTCERAAAFSFFQMANCTLIRLGSFIENLAQVLKT